jgi:tetratricopeptide (TPR) repeat protein
MSRSSPRIVIPIIFAVACAGSLTALLGWQVARTRMLLSNQMLAAQNAPTHTIAIPDLQLTTRDTSLVALRAGDIAALQGNWAEAEKQYRSAADARGGLPALRKLAQAQLQRRDLPGVQQTIDRLKRGGARTEDILLLESIAALRGGELVAAQSMLESAQPSPQRSYAQGLLAVVQGDHDTAKERLQETEAGWEPVLRSHARTLLAAYDEFALFPGSPNIHLITLLSRALAQAQECELALPLLAQVTQQQDDYRDAWIVQGYCELTTERTEQALASFERAYAIDPEKPEIQYLLGRTLLARGEAVSALTFLQYALKNGFQPETEVRTTLARAAAAAGDAPLALQQYEALLLRDDADVTITESLVATALAANLIGDAERAAAAATTRWPENASAWELVGRTAMAAGKTEEARAAFARAKQLDPGIATSVMEIR